VRGLFVSTAVALLCSATAILPARAQDLRVGLEQYGQVREGDFSGDTEAPMDFYGDLGLIGIRHGIGAETFFRLNRDFGRDEGEADFYAGYMTVPNVASALDFTLGRQFLNEAPGSVYVADAGKIRFDPGWPVAFSVFGGQPQYFEPTYSTERLSQDEQIWGGSVSTTRLRGAQLRLAYLQEQRDSKTLRQLISGTFSRVFTELPLSPNTYGTVSYDADRQDFDLGNIGANVFLTQPRLFLNGEWSYYRPQDQDNGIIVTDPNRREDPIFQAFSVSEMTQFRLGARHPLTPALSLYADYSFQRYQPEDGNHDIGHVGGAGMLWLPGGDGLEVVRLEYYIIDSAGGTVNGGKGFYESQVYERIIFRTKLDVAYYEKLNNEKDAAVSGMLSVGYVILPGFVWELAFEANHNDRFNEDFRFGFAITYNRRYTLGRDEMAAEQEASS
jgi:hypothetical protein